MKHNPDTLIQNMAGTITLLKFYKERVKCCTFTWVNSAEMKETGQRILGFNDLMQ